MPRIIPDEKARQGPKGRPVLMVLIGAFVLLGIYLVGLMIWAYMASPDPVARGAPNGEGAAAVPPSAPANPTTRIPPANPAYPVPVDPSTTGTPSR